jgi:deoxyguanosine kinase
MAERYKQLKELVHTADLFQSVTISDYLFTKCLLFAKVNLPDQEFRLYQKLFEIINAQVVQPDILIYLHAPVSKLQANIRKRNRSYEQSIPDELPVQYPGGLYQLYPPAQYPDPFHRCQQRRLPG